LKGDAGDGRRHYYMQLPQFGILLLKNCGGFR
jgi:putative component of toxin-antitoxin plasmid stabilization module